MMRHDDRVEVDVWICGPSGISVAEWKGPVPANGDRIVVVVAGDQAAEPGTKIGVVVAREWRHESLINESVHRVRRQCIVKVEWLEEDEVLQ